MELLTNNLAEVLIFLGLVLLVFEVVVLGLSTFVLFFVGLSCILASILILLGLLPDTLGAAFLSIAIFSVLLTVVLWKPLKSMQNKVEHKPAQNDLIGYSFVLADDVSSSKESTQDYSGITWRVKSATEIAAGTTVEVVQTDVGAFTVKAVV